MKKHIILTLTAAAFVLTACEKDFLERYPEGGTIRQDQYEKLADKLEGSVRGFYTKLYTMGGGHDEFGKRSIDLWGDILCCDIALTGKTYGWLYTDEQMLTNGRSATIWSHYYSQIHNINATIRLFKNVKNLDDKLQQYGYPSKLAEGTENPYSEQDYDDAILYAQALGLRGYMYAQLAKFYTPVANEATEAFKGYNITTYKCCPVYNEANMDSPQDLSVSSEVYNQAFSDLSFAIELYEEFGAGYMRPNKLTIDKEVICGILAYAYLNEAVYYQQMGDMDTYNAHLILARDYALETISPKCTKYQIISNADLLTTGFNNVSDKSWMWGQEVTVETSGGLKSWFGQVDIHSYSYAWAGDTKVIDQELYRSMSAWDKRRLWFNDGKKNSTYSLCPDGKFFSAQNPNSTDEDDIDRDWLSDNVFMRIESMYLIAAEAEWRLNNDAQALAYLREITDQRVNADIIVDEDFGTTGQQEYDSDVATWINHETLGKRIVYNWRVEMWGEGYGLDTFRRWQDARPRGSNHDYAAGNRMTPTDSKFQFQMPTNENTYNPNLKTTTLP